MMTALTLLALSIAASFLLAFVAFVLYIFSLPSRLRVHAPLCDGPKRSGLLRWLGLTS